MGMKQPGVLEWDEEKLQCATGRKAPWWRGEEVEEELFVLGSSVSKEVPLKMT